MDSRLARPWQRIVAPVVLALHSLVGAAWATPQPIPVELTLGRDSITTNLVVSRPFTSTSPLGFFHLSTLQFDYERDAQTEMAIQNVFFVELAGGLRAIGGAFNSERGFNPTAGLQYIKGNRDLFLVISPRVNFATEPSYSVCRSCGTAPSSRRACGCTPPGSCSTPSTQTSTSAATSGCGSGSR
jgi:hypothetical protein